MCGSVSRCSFSKICNWQHGPGSQKDTAGALSMNNVGSGGGEPPSATDAREAAHYGSGMTQRRLAAQLGELCPRSGCVEFWWVFRRQPDTLMIYSLFFSHSYRWWISAKCNSRLTKYRGLCAFLRGKKYIKYNHIWGVGLYLPLPNSETLVVRCAHKATVLINKRDGVDGSQVTVVLLNDLTWPDVPLTEGETNRNRGGQHMYQVTPK